MIVREILTDTGARAEVEAMITGFRARARQALDKAVFPFAASAELDAICETATACAA